MASFKIGVMVDSFRLPMVDGLKKAKEVGADGFQVYALDIKTGTPWSMTRAQCQDYRKMVDDQGLEISALCGDLGGHGFQLEAENASKIERSKAVVDLAANMGAKVVTTHIGIIPVDGSSPIYQNQLKVCRILGKYAEENGVTFAIETGPEVATVLASFLKEVGSRGIGVNMDPANLIMMQNSDPVKDVFTLKDYIVHTHAKDGVQYKSFDPAIAYMAFAEGGVEGFNFGDYFDELPLGSGKVDWDKYLNALTQIGYHGYLTIERETGDNPEADIRTAVNFLKAKI